MRPGRLLACVAVGLMIWALPKPEGLEQPEAWRLLAIFAAVIAGFVLNPVRMGPMVILGLVASGLLGALSTKAIFAGYGKSVVWLVLGAFLLAGLVRRSGLGRRISLNLVVRLGRSTLGLGYALAASELVLGPLVPSNTARGGGILAPIVNALSRALGSRPGDTPRQAGEYLCLVGAHTNLITAAMFLTGMAANPLVAQAASDVYDVDFGWGTWALGAIVPGLCGLLLLPLLLHKLAPPAATDATAARETARRELAAMGAMTRDEQALAAIFVLLLGLWSTASLHGLSSTLVVWVGLSILLLAGTLSWAQVVGETDAWDALVWLGGLLSLATGLKDLGVVTWFASEAQTWVAGLGVLPTVLVLAVIYYYSMYGFSMLTAHITAMVGAFLALCLAAEVPALLAVPLLAYLSNLCACTTNYSTGPVVIYYGLGYVPASRWFAVGFVVSLFHLAIWLPVGLAWWKLLGWW